MAETPAMASCAALGDVLRERERQDAKWGEQNHCPLEWLAVLTEEVGELAEAINKHHWNDGSLARVREEAIHCAAVALAMVECLDRGTWWTGPSDDDGAPGEG